MQLRKIKGTRLFDGYRLRDDVVLVLDNDGGVQDIVPFDAEDRDIEYFEGWIVPGLINCHCHLELSHMKGRIPKKTGLVDFVFAVVTDRHTSEQEIRVAIESAESEMIATGIVAVGDICNNTFTLEQKEQGKILYYNFIESSGWLPTVSNERFQRALSIYQAFDYSEKRSIVPHAPYSVSEALWDEIRPFFKSRVVSMHNQETAFEDEFFQTGKGDFERMYKLMKIDNSHHVPGGRSSLQTSFDKLQGASSIMLVHNSFTSAEDIQYAMNRSDDPSKLFFCLCPNANLYIEDRLPPVELLVSSGAQLVIGTDSLASNDSLSILDEIRTLQTAFPQIDLSIMLQWATSNGARALEMNDLGSFERGKHPGVLLLNPDSLEVKRLA